MLHWLHLTALALPIPFLNERAVIIEKLCSQLISDVKVAAPETALLSLTGVLQAARAAAQSSLLIWFD